MTADAPLRVLNVVLAAPQIGGLELSFARIRPALEQAGIASSALVIGSDPGSATVLAEYLPVTQTEDAATVDSALRAADVIHVHGADCTTWAHDVPRRARRMNRPVVFTIHLPSYPPVGAWSPGRVRVSAKLLLDGIYLRRNTDRVLAPSTAAATTANRRFGPWLGAQRFLHGVPDHGATAVPGGPLRLAFVGRLDQHKQPLVFVESVALAVADGVDVYAEMAGDGSLADDVRDLVSSRGLEDRVTLLGRIPHPDELLRRSHVLVFTSDAEGCPVSAIEAAAVGRGTVCRTGIEGITEMWGDGAVLVSPLAGAREFASTYADLAADLSRAERMGAAARRLFEREFDGRMAAVRWAELYRSV